MFIPLRSDRESVFRAVNKNFPDQTIRLDLDDVVNLIQQEAA